MKDEIERLIPLIKAGNVSDVESKHIIDRIRQSIKEDASKGKAYGDYLRLINQALKFKELRTEVNWVQVGNGHLAIGHKPGGKISFEGLKKEGASFVLTLLHENEGAATIGKQLHSVNIGWIWFPFSASKPHEGDNIVQIYSLYSNLSTLMDAGNNIYIHCSAGIHRTGMITYGFLRFLGKSKSEALAILQSLREVTASQVGADRLVWADQFVIQQR